MAKTEFIKKYRKDIIFYSLSFLVMIVLNRASIIGLCRPFGFGFLFSLAYLGKNAFILAPLFFISFIVFNFSLEGIIIVGSMISVFLLLFLIFKALRQKINFVCTLVFALISQVGYVYFNISSPTSIFTTLLSLAVGLIFVYVCCQAIGAIMFRGLQSRMTTDEYICFSIFLIAFFSGLSTIYVFNVNLTNVIVLSLLLVSSRSLQRITTISLSLLAGFGVAFAGAGISYIAIYASWGIVCAILNNRRKVFSIIAVMMFDLIFGMLFNVYATYTYLNIIPLALVGIIFICLKEKMFNYIRGLSFSYDGRLTEEFIIEGQKELLKKKLLKLSDLFKQMQIAYRNLSVGDIDRNEACEVLAEELIKKHCFSCPKYSQCLENLKIKESIMQLFEFGLEKKRVTIIDANNLITTSCVWLTSIINEVNQSLSNYFEYEKQVKTQDNSKMLISEQLSGTGDIFEELSKLVIGGERINEKASKTLLEELTLCNVVVNEVLVLDGELGVEKVVLAIRNDDALSPNITECLRSVFNIDFIVITRKMSRFAGWSILSYVPAPKYIASVGFATLSKTQNEVSGDTYSFTKLDDNRLLFALADGMGHGERANQISTIALSLIESFYRSGFSSQTIISSVNKILLPTGVDDFTTLDVCVLDISNGTADFIKIGATASVIKSKDGCKVVSEENLPLGVVGTIKPKARKVIIKSGDIIVLASDGIVDTFDDIEDFSNFVNNEIVVNAQMMADLILEEAESRERDHKDDKTVIAIKVNEN